MARFWVRYRDSFLPTVIALAGIVIVIVIGRSDALANSREAIDPHGVEHHDPQAPGYHPGAMLERTIDQLWLNHRQLRGLVL